MVMSAAAGGRWAVLRALSGARAGLTDEELQDATHLGANTERPRRVELVVMGLVTGMDERRITRSGRSAVVWAITPAGQRKVEEAA